MRHLKHLDLGVLDDTVLLFGGPYSNAQAMQALVAKAAVRGIAGGQMICTGDVVAYAGDPVETVAQIRALGCAVVAGNCEIQIAQGAPDCGCGFEEGTACDLLSVGWFDYATQQIDIADKSWMGDLPDVVTFTHFGKRYAVIHGGVDDVARFIWRTTPEAVLNAEWDALEQAIGTVNHIIAGHSGIPFQREMSRGRWINAGVIGMPAHDGHQETCFATLEKGEVTFHPLAYDANRAAARMKAAGLPPDYAQSLLSGYWPSEDILPDALRVRASASG